MQIKLHDVQIMIQLDSSQHELDEPMGFRIPKWQANMSNVNATLAI